MPPVLPGGGPLARRRSSPADFIAAADSWVSQNACTEMRGPAWIWSLEGRSGGAGSCDASLIACSIFFFVSLIVRLLFAYVAELGLVAFGICGRARVTLAILFEAFGAPHGVGRRLRARLHEVGRIGDHGREVALRRAAEIVILLVLVVGRVVDVRPEIVRPGAARTRGCRDLGVAQPDRRQLLGSGGTIGGRGGAVRRPAAGPQ